MLTIKATVDVGRGWTMELVKKDHKGNWPATSGDRDRLLGELTDLLCQRFGKEFYTAEIRLQLN